MNQLNYDQFMNCLRLMPLLTLPLFIDNETVAKEVANLLNEQEIVESKSKKRQRTGEEATPEPAPKGVVNTEGKSKQVETTSSTHA